MTTITNTITVLAHTYDTGWQTKNSGRSPFLEGLMRTNDVVCVTCSMYITWTDLFL